jgi:penicillin G amidase
MRRVLLLAIAFAVALPPLMAQSSPWVRYPGMRGAGQVTRDANGIAQIRALTDYDAVYLNGWVHAQDRLFQMDENRRIASGTFAELVGQPALPTDVQLRTLGLRRAAELSYLELSPRLRELLGAYAAGVNAWVAANPLPPEYGALEITRFDPWTPLDSVAVAKLLAFGLSFSLDDIDNTIALLTYQGAGNLMGFDGTKLFFEDLFRSAPFDPASTIPDATAGAGIEAVTAFATAETPGSWTASAEIAANALDRDAVEQARSYLEHLREIPFFEQILDPDQRGASNLWAVAGKHTTTGNAMIANDPHLALRMPSTFYPLAIRGSRINAAGVGFPGAPLVVQGHTERIAWGSTVNPMDVTDVYQEQIVPDTTAPAGLSTMHGTSREHLFPVLQTFRANFPASGTANDVRVIPHGGAIPQASLIVTRRNAPIISFNQETGAALSVQWIGHGATRELDTFLIWNEARNLDDFRDGLQYFDVGSQNWVYTDVDGNIAWFTSGEMPLRSDLQSGTVTGLPPMFLRSNSGANDWIRIQSRPAGQSSMYQILPAAEMPHLINPASGWIINANNDPAGTTLDNDPINQLRPGGGIYYLSPGYSGFRAGRITQLLRGQIQRGEKVSFQDMQRIQADVVLLDAQYFVPYITAAFAHASLPGHPGGGFVANPAIASAVARLAAWDFSTPTGIPEGYDASDVNGVLSAPSAAEVQASIAATIYSVWRGQILKNTIDAVLAQGNLPSPGSALAVTALRNILDNYSTRHGFGASGVPFFNVPGVPNTPETGGIRRDVVILKSLADALELLASEEFAPAFARSTDQNDYRWGKLHRIEFAHPLGSLFNTPPAGGAFPPPLPGLRGIPVDGGFEVVDASSHNSRAATLNGFMFGSGPVRRSVSEATPTGIRAVSSLPGGPSGVVTSPLYVNLLRQWLTNDTFEVPLQPAGPVLPWGAR